MPTRQKRPTGARVIALVASVTSLMMVSSPSRGEPPIRYVPPAATDAAVDQPGTGDHLVALAGGYATGYLVLFFPGTGGAPADYETLLSHAASLGHHVLGLSYLNDASVNGVYCRGQLGTTCHEDVRTEILTGEDRSDLVEVDEANSAYGRLRRALQYLDASHPEERWGSFLNAGEIAWHRVIVAGQSQGGGHAALTAKRHRVARAVLFSATEPAPWTGEPGATPPAAYVAVAHELEPNYTGIVNSWDLLAIPGALTPIDGITPWAAASQRLTTARMDCGGDPDSRGFFHNCTSADAFLPAPNDSGQPAFADLWTHLFLAQPEGLAGPVFVAGPMGEAGVGYIDPEVLHAERQLTFQDSLGSIHLAAIDPVDGRFVQGGGREFRLDNGAWPVSETFNGPEFGIDRDGWAVFYTKANGGVPSLWRAHVEDGVAIAEPLTAAFRRQTVLASKNPDAEQTRLLFSRGPRGTGEVTWQDEDDAASETPLGFYDEGVRWIDGSFRFVRTIDSGALAGQLELVDTESGERRLLTDDPGWKSFPYGFQDPESGRLQVLALVENDTAIGIWQERDQAQPFERIATIRVPGAEGQSLGSPEPFTAAGRSWLSFVLREARPAGPAQVWLASTDGSELWRCDDGEPELARSDPETLVIGASVFVYYNVIAADGYRLYRCGSDLPGANLTGLWWNPAQPGWGIQLDEQGDVLFGTWHTYDAAGAPIWFALDQASLASDGSYSGQLFVSEEQPYPDVKTDGPELRQVGSVLFQRLGQGELLMIATVEGNAVTSTLERAPLAPAACGATLPRPGVPSNLTGIWWDPASPGRGLALAQQREVLFLALFTQDLDGNPTWATALLERTAPSRFDGPLTQATSGVPYFGIDGPATDFPLPEIGRASIDVRADGLRFEASFHDETVAYDVERLQLTPPGTACIDAD